MSKNIYWANLTLLPDEIMTPRPLLKDLSESQSERVGSNFVACPAISQKHKNTFLTTIPHDISVTFLNGQCYASDTKITERPGLYKNSYAFNWNIERIFFSEVSQIMEVSPAFLHQTSYSFFGHAPSGAFDIGNWFRPSSPTFQLWSNNTTFKANKDEAHLYFNFPNQEKVILTQFKMSEKLFEIMDTCVNYKFINPKQPLKSIYQMFQTNDLRKSVIKEIKNNILAPKF